MSSKLSLLLLLVATVLLATVDASRRRQQIQRNVLPEEDCDDGEEIVMKPGKSPRVGSSNPRRKNVVQQDEGDGVEDPTDEDYLRYEDTNQEGICILGKVFRVSESSESRASEYNPSFRRTVTQ